MKYFRNQSTDTKYTNFIVSYCLLTQLVSLFNIAELLSIRVLKPMEWPVEWHGLVVRVVACS